ncbi:MAG: AsmA family protein [Sphingobacteriales bacterium]|nr:AsmA family protein [Sphingobacteriales bacterium]
MLRWIRIILKVTGILLVLLLMIWMGVAAYVQLNKQYLLKTVTKQLNEELSGKLTIEKMEPALIKGFPGISVSLKNVLLRDSLWSQHHHDLLKAEEVYISIDAISIIIGSPTIKNITVNKGNIYLFTDSLGYSNTSLLRNKSSDTSSKGGNGKKLNRLNLNDVTAIYENKSRFKLFSLYINNFNGKITYQENGWSANAKLNTLVNNLAFNTNKGSFLTNKTLAFDIMLLFNNKNQVLSVPKQEIRINDNPVNLGANFTLASKVSDFNLNIDAKSITLKEASELLPRAIAQKLDRYILENPVSVQAEIKGKLKHEKDPSVKIYWQTKNNVLKYNNETITNSNFSGYFNNQVKKELPRVDSNSVISFYQMKGTWMDIPFQADSIIISNLTKPILIGKFVSNFPLTKLNPIIGEQTFSFRNGTAQLNLFYQAPFNQRTYSNRFITGSIKIKNAAATYKPRNLSFKNVRLNLDFKGQDLYVNDMQVESGNNKLYMNGSVKNVTNFYYTNPSKILLDWNISSPQINLGEFLAFLGKRKSTKAPQKNLNSMSRQLDIMLDEASVHMKMKVNHVIFKRFVAENVISNIVLKQSGIEIRNVSLRHAGGSLKINGNIDQSGAYNRMNVNTQIDKANIQQLFYAFNNFGQTSITDKNISGTFNAIVNASGSIKDDGTVVPRSIKGTVNFNLRNGALINFEPIQNVGAFAFPNRNFKNITFENLQNTLTINGNSVTIPPMQISSSVINVFLEGVYGFTSGTNIALQVPLRNPKRDSMIVNKSEKDKRAKKGIVINLHTVEGPDGKVKLKLGKN